MKPISFPQANKMLKAPARACSVSDGTPIDPLPVFSNGMRCISCWELSDQEREAIARGEKLWLHVLSGPTQPPVALEIGEAPTIP